MSVGFLSYSESKPPHDDIDDNDNDNGSKENANDDKDMVWMVT